MIILINALHIKCAIESLALCFFMWIAYTWSVLQSQKYVAYLAADILSEHIHEG